MTDEQTTQSTNLTEVVEVVSGGKKNVILDATVLSTIMGCGRLTDFRFNHNFQSLGGKSNSLEVGSVVHKFLEVYYGSVIKGLPKSQAEGFGFAAAELYIQGCPSCTDFESTTELTKPECGHKPNDYPGIFNTPKENEGYLVGWHWALDTCQQYLDFYRNDFWVPIATEIVKGKILYEDDEIRVLWKAKLDWIVDTNQGIFPCDHKTMKQNRETVKTNNQFMGQCLVMETRAMIKNNIGFQKTLKPEEKFKREMISYSGHVLTEWYSEILPYYAKALIMYHETGFFPPNFDHCETRYGKCAFLPVCASDPDERENVIKKMFFVGPTWNPTNDDDE